MYSVTGSSKQGVEGGGEVQLLTCLEITSDKIQTATNTKDIYVIYFDTLFACDQDRVG